MILYLTIFSSILFLFYGLQCLFTKQRMEEFERYDLFKFRKLIGILETLGGAGLIIGYYFSQTIFLVASGGLTALLMAAVYTRLKAKDPFIQLIPALGLLIVNAAIFTLYLLT